MKVFLSPLAEEKLTLLLDFLVAEWSQKVRNEFLKKFKKAIQQISEHPFSCPQSKQLNVFKCVVTKQCSFYYRIQQDEIEIITVIDNRQGPKDIEKLLKRLSS